MMQVKMVETKYFDVFLGTNTTNRKLCYSIVYTLITDYNFSSEKSVYPTNENIFSNKI